jgi:PAS domain S-box-containing protein
VVARRPQSYFLRLLAAFSMVVVVAFSMAATLILVVGGNTVRQLVEEHLLLQAQVANHDVDEFFLDRSRDLLSWSTLAVMDDVLTDDQGFKIQNFLLDVQHDERNHYPVLTVLNRDKVIIASTRIEESGQVWSSGGLELPDEPVAGLVLSVYPVKESGSWSELLMAYPIVTELHSDPAGWLIAAMNWRQVETLLQSSRFLQDRPAGAAYMLLVSDNGELLAEDSRAGGLLDEMAGVWPDDLNPDNAEELLSLDGRFLVATSAGPDGETSTPHGFWAIALWDSSDAYASMHSFTILVISSAVTGLLLSLVASFLIARYFTRGIRNLMEGTDRLAQGELDYRVWEGEDDELGRLAKSFNTMGASLARVQKRLRTALARWESLVENAPDLILTLDPKGNILYSNKAIDDRTRKVAGTSSFQDFVPEKSRSIVAEKLSRVFDHAESVRFELTSRGGGDSIRWSSFRVGPVVRDGEVVAATVISTDISDLKTLEKEVLSVSEEERKRIGRDLHDGVGQVLTGVALFSKGLRMKLSRKNLKEADDAREIELLMNRAVSETRAVAKGLFPMEIDVAGLRGSLEEMARGVQVLSDVSCIVGGEATLPVENSEDAMHLYRIAQEAVSNAVKHGKPSQIQIRLVQDKALYGLVIEDDGSGLESRRDQGMGLRMMAHRADMIGATLQIVSEKKNGTSVSCMIELRATEGMGS